MVKRTEIWPHTKAVAGGLLECRDAGAGQYCAKLLDGGNRPREFAIIAAELVVAQAARADGRDVRHADTRRCLTLLKRALERLDVLVAFDARCDDDAGSDAETLV